MRSIARFSYRGRIIFTGNRVPGDIVRDLTRRITLHTMCLVKQPSAVLGLLISVGEVGPGHVKNIHLAHARTGISKSVSTHTDPLYTTTTSQASENPELTNSHTPAWTTNYVSGPPNS